VVGGGGGGGGGWPVEGSGNVSFFLFLTLPILKICFDQDQTLSLCQIGSTQS